MTPADFAYFYAVAGSFSGIVAGLCCRVSPSAILAAFVLWPLLLCASVVKGAYELYCSIARDE